MPAPAVGTTIRRIDLPPRQPERERRPRAAPAARAAASPRSRGRRSATSRRPARARRRAPRSFPNATTTTVQMKTPATIEGVDSSTSETSRIARRERGPAVLGEVDGRQHARAAPRSASRSRRSCAVPMNACTMPPDPGRSGPAGSFVKKLTRERADAARDDVDRDHARGGTWRSRRRPTRTP